MKEIVILYATETGNSQDLAQLLGLKLRRLLYISPSMISNSPADKVENAKVNVSVYSMDEYLPQISNLFNPEAVEVEGKSLDSTASETHLFTLVSTTGQGEIPKSAQKLWKFLLRKKLPPNLFSKIKFSSFGLGDSSYPRYNWAVRKVHTRFVQLGAQESIPRAEADEQSPDGTDRVYQEWEDMILKDISQRYLADISKLAQNDSGVGFSDEIIDNESILPPINPILINKHDKSTVIPDSKAVALSRVEQKYSSVKFYKAKLSELGRITDGKHYQDVRHIVLSVQTDSPETEEYFKYSPGDTVSLYPSNNPDDVDILLKHLGWADVADMPIQVTTSFVRQLYSISGLEMPESLNTTKDGYYSPNGENSPLVSPLTVRTLMTHHLDITAVPRRSFFENVYRFSRGEPEFPAREREKLKEFTTLDGLEDLFNYANRPRRSIMETLTEFESIKIPVEYATDIFPILRPRLFSIASYPQTNTSSEVQVELCVALVKYRTILRRIRQGVCSRWLETLSSGDSVVISLGRNHLFKAAPILKGIPNSTGAPSPLILIAAGTGVAPIRSLMQYYFGNSSNHNNNQPPPPEIHLFLGFRHPDLDFHYHEEWKNLLEYLSREQQKQQQPKVHIYVAFSRAQTSDLVANPRIHPTIKTKAGVHLQSLLYDAAEEMGDLILNQNAGVYMCGASGKFPRETRMTFSGIVKDYLKNSAGIANVEDETLFETQAEAYIKQMEQSGRFVQETW